MFERLLLTICVMVLGFLAIPLSGVLGSTTDHEQHEVLQQEFATGPDVTETCLSCHTEAAEQVQRTRHWTWVCPQLEHGAGKVVAVNNFCIALPSNEPRCTQCHSGYNWRDQNFDFTEPANVDCLVCHEQTGEYKKFPTGAGHPTYEEQVFGGRTWYPPDLGAAARSVGRPTRANCGACHFFGGGGDGVKHGDMDSSLLNPSRDLDVHMAVGGANFSCVDCHETVEHGIGGGCSSRLTEDTDLLTPVVACANCHTERPHHDSEHAERLNHHTDRITCQTCHIPTFARLQPTKMSWDWEQAGQRDEEGRPIVRRDEEGNVIYDGRKGAFTWATNVVPEYRWWNGCGERVVICERINPHETVTINRTCGDADDPDALIWPFKAHHGRQMYDSVQNCLVAPRLYGPPGSGAYWSDYDWDAAIQAGMDYLGLEYSGEHGFVNTVMYWAQNHMVAPAENALACADCHTRVDSRMAAVSGIYTPRLDGGSALDTVGWLMVLFLVGAVVTHATLRVVGAWKRAMAATVGTREGENDQ